MVFGAFLMCLARYTIAVVSDPGEILPEERGHTTNIIGWVYVDSSAESFWEYAFYLDF